MELKPRPHYLSKLAETRDNGFIKVITGMRRCGKSCLLALYAEYLGERGVPKRNVVYINFESFFYEDVRTSRDMHELIKSRIAPEGRTYLLLDEVQMVEGWERAVNGLRIDDDVDIYVTGSNAHLLSSQIATLLSGRSLEISVYPLSFGEFCSFVGEGPTDGLFERYVRYGGLPPVVEQGSNQGLASTVLSGIYSTIFVRDIAQYAQVRNQPVFDDIACYLADTAGSGVSITNIEKRLSAAHRKTSTETIERYIQAMVDAFMFRRAQRVEVKGGGLLQGLCKYYPTDLGIKNMLVGFSSGDYGFALETVVHNELVLRGYEVRVGKTEHAEIDFAARRLREDLTEEKLLMQVSSTMLDPKTRDRELRPLEEQGSTEARKLVLTLDRVALGFAGTHGDIEIVNAIDWLCGS